MGFSVYTNVMSRAIRRQATDATSRISQNQQRLSTGLRINSAADDAAGLAISKRMDDQVRGKTVAQRNIADGISMMQTADSGLAEIGTILQKLRESAVGAASDTNNASDRKTLDDEANQLIAALDQIASSTMFNGKHLLDGSTQTVRLQTGANNRSEESVSLSFSNMSSAAMGQLVTETFTTVSASTAGTIVGGGDMVINGVEIIDSQPYATSVGHAGTNEQQSSAYAKGQAIIDSNIEATVEIIPPKVTHTFAAPASGAGGYNLEINGVRIYTNDLASSVEDLTTHINSFSDQTGVIATVQSSGSYTLETLEGRNINMRVGGTSATATQQGFRSSNQYRGGLKFKSDNSIHIVGKADVLGAPSADYSILADTNTVQSHVDFSTRDSALESIDRLDVAIDQVLAQRAKMGSTINQLEVTSSSLAATNESLSAAKGRIMDADFSMETAAMTREQILQQASMAMLSQANQAPRNLLSLIS